MRDLINYLRYFKLSWLLGIYWVQLRKVWHIETRETRREKGKYRLSATCHLMQMGNVRTLISDCSARRLDEVWRVSTTDDRTANCRWDMLLWMEQDIGRSQIVCVRAYVCVCLFVWPLCKRIHSSVFSICVRTFSPARWQPAAVINGAWG